MRENTSKRGLRHVPLSELVDEVEARKRELKKKHGPAAMRMVLHQCLGCRGEFSTTEMRTHPCPSGMNYHRRMGKVYDSKQKKYVWPKGKKAA